MAVVALSSSAPAQGLAAATWGWRASHWAPGVPGKPPDGWLYGPLAPVFWNEIFPEMVARAAIPPQRPGYGPYVPPPPAYARPGPPSYGRPLPPAYPAPYAAPA